MVVGGVRVGGGFVQASTRQQREGRTKSGGGRRSGREWPRGGEQSMARGAASARSVRAHLRIVAEDEVHA
eukprot:5441838-Pleurochrysis_carterae.AAC.3